MSSSSIKDLLQPELLRSVNGLQLLARHTVEAIRPGSHQSRRTGQGQEFNQYRAYQPGDDVRLLDWKLFARSDRYYIREANQQKVNPLHFFLDASASMSYAEGGIKKLDYLRYIAATLAWLALQMGDPIGWSFLQSGNSIHMPAKYGFRQFQRFLYQLVAFRGVGHFPASTNQHPRFFNGTLIFISDLYEQATELQDFIKAKKYSKSDPLVLQLLGPDEKNMNFPHGLTFQDLETGQKIALNNNRPLKTYLQQRTAYWKNMQQQFLSQGIAFETILLGQDIGPVIRQVLLSRNKR